MMAEPGPPLSPHGDGCPDPEVLAGLVLGERTAEERQALADHVVGCARCAADFRLLRELDAEARPKRRMWRGRVWGIALVAAATVAIASAVSMPRNQGDATRSPVVAVRPPDGATLEPGSRGSRSRS